MVLKTEFEVMAPPLRWDEAGGIRVGQSRVTLDSLLAAYQNGSTPEEIAVQFPVLSLGEIYSAIAYAITHPEQMDSYLSQRREQAEKRREMLTQKHNLASLRQRLQERRKFSTDGH